MSYYRVVNERERDCPIEKEEKSRAFSMCIVVEGTDCATSKGITESNIKEMTPELEKAIQKVVDSFINKGTYETSVDVTRYNVQEDDEYEDYDNYDEHFDNVLL